MTPKSLKLIKRYQNRKLYDTSDSCYVTLEDIGDMIKQGEDVQIIDNQTKEDLTAVTLAQIIFEEQKKKTHVLPLSTFKQIIQSGGETLRGFVNKAVESGGREFQHVREIVDEKIRPTMDHIRELPAVQLEVKGLKDKIEALEAKLKDYEKKVTRRK
jgi:polyhydroxyalkanoate synthesis repressor PhaR